MGRSKRHYKLRCSKCYEKWWEETKWDVPDMGRVTLRYYNNIEILEMKGEGVNCKCKKCGHTYVSYSEAVYRLAG